MPVTAADVQRLIILRVGDIDPATGDPPIAGGAGMVASNMPTLWMVRSDKAVAGPRLQELYVQRDALDLVIALLRQQVDVVQGDPQLSVRQSQRVSTAETQRKATQDEIGLIETRLQKSRNGALAPIRTTAPVAPPQPGSWPPTATPGVRDANSPSYRGDPYWPRRY